MKAHRVAWILSRGPIPGGMLVCHHCDNPPCCNPDHLFIGTHADNIRDRTQKNRSYQGERVWTNKLTEAQVIEIRMNFVPANGRRGARRGRVSNCEIARRYGVTDQLISQILRGKVWKHILYPVSRKGSAAS